MTEEIPRSATKDRVVPAAGSVRKPWPWKVWAALILTFVAGWAAQFVFQPRMTVSAATLSFPKDQWAVEFEATNHTKEPLAADLAVIVAYAVPGSKARVPGYTEVGRNRVTVFLAPKESQRVTSVFPANVALSPNAASVEIEAIAGARR